MDEEIGEDRGSITFLMVFFPASVAFARHKSGFVLGWPTVLPKIQSDNSTSFEVTDNDVKWLVSVVGIAGMICTLAVGPIIESLGPRRLLLIIQIPSFLLWLLAAFTPYISLLYISRIGLVLIFAILGPLPPLLICEMSDKKIRGFTLAMQEIIVAVSLLIMYIMADKLYWVTTTAVCALPAATLFIVYLFLPESPYWLARNGQLDEAERSLYKLRASKSVAAEEIAHLTASVKDKPHMGTKEQIKELQHSQNFRPVILVTTILILRELGGEYVVFNYSVYIFMESGVDLDPFYCTVMVGVIRLLFALASSLLTDRVGRRPLLIFTSLGCAASAAVFGVFTLLQLPGTSLVPLISLLAYVAFYSLGIGPIPWGLAGELIPTPVRVVGGCICTFGYSISVFTVGYLFPIIMDSFGMGYIFLFFSTVYVITSVILLLCLPEPKGKSLTELQDAFQSSKKHGRSARPVTIGHTQEISDAEETTRI